MKVLLVNGGPHKEGCTYTALKEVEKTLNDLGMNIADAVTVFLKQVVMTNSIPFMIKKPTFNKETIEAIKEADAIMEKPEDYKSYDNVYDMIEEIDNEN